ncbi:N5-carboxyaminoimidazole ribonucleotide mutase [Spirochaetia bacterium]|nr:N5-carboxyaminoimidazole ribonucleotide mutase [Spirochaetia bacterium]
MKALIIFGSQSDKPVMQKAAGVLREFGISFSSHVVSAHRSPELLEKIIADCEADGTEVIIAGAGLAAHLPGVIASKTLIPVIGVPITAGALNGMDALFSIVQMPKSVPVATVGVDNAANAAYLAAELLGIKYPLLRKKLEEARTTMKDDLAKNSKVDL